MDMKDVPVNKAGYAHQRSNLYTRTLSPHYLSYMYIALALSLSLSLPPPLTHLYQHHRISDLRVYVNTCIYLST